MHKKNKKKWKNHECDEKSRENQTSRQHKPLIENQDDYKRYKLIKLFREYVKEKHNSSNSLNKFLDYCKLRGVEVKEQELYKLMDVHTWQELTIKMGNYHELDYRVRLRVLDAGVNYVREFGVLPDQAHWTRWAEDHDLPDNTWIEERFGSWDYFINYVRNEIVKRYSYDMCNVERQIVKDYLTTGKLPDYERLLRKYQKGDSFHPILIIGLYGSFDNLKDEIDSMVIRVIKYEMAQFSEWTDKPFTPDEWNRYARLTDFVEYDRIEEYLARKIDVKDKPADLVILLNEFIPEITRVFKNRKRVVRRRPNTETWYDHDSLVRMVKELAQELGRTPKVKEFLERYDISAKNIQKCTKNYQNLLIDAGLSPNKIFSNDEELLFLGREVVIRMDGCISSIQWDELRKKGWVLPSRLTIFRRFGSWDRFWDAVAERFPEVADLIARTNSKKRRAYSRKELIDMGYRIFKKTGHIANATEWKRIYKKEGLASSATIFNTFGSFKTFWEEVAKEYPEIKDEIKEKLNYEHKRYASKELINAGYQVFNHFHGIPSCAKWELLREEMDLPSIGTIRKWFETYSNFWYEVAKHYPDVEDYLLTQRPKRWTREDILNAGVVVSSFLGHPPSSYEWNKLRKEYPNDFGWLPAVFTCSKHFEGWKRFVEEVAKVLGPLFAKDPKSKLER